MKAFLTIILIFFVAKNGIAQTRDVDYNFIINHYTQNVNDLNYKTTTLLKSSKQGQDGVTVSLEFASVFSSSDSKRRGIAMIYRELINQNSKISVFCVPENNSDPNILKKCFTAIQQINDTNLMGYFMWGLMQLAVKN